MGAVATMEAEWYRCRRVAIGGERFVVYPLDVIERVRGTRPNDYRRDRVRVEGVDYPCVEALAQVLGRHPNDIQGATARRLFQDLGFWVYQVKGLPP